MKKKTLTKTTIINMSIIFLAATIFSIYQRVTRSDKSEAIVILSTNDMHAQIDKYPMLATAIERCRDTAQVILVDAGDRFTGNAYVDKVKHHTPVYEMMNYVGYDIAIYGNHEFDWGQAYLAEANRQAEFEILGANIKSDTTTFPQPPAHLIIERNGIKFGFVGVVSNYDNGHPSGKDESYEGVTFADPLKTAAEYSYLKDEGCDVLILVSHVGLDRDEEFAANSELSKGYDMIIGGHSHDKTNKVVNGVLIGQTKNKLSNIGATVVTMGADGKPKLTYSNIPLSNYEPEPTMAELAERYRNNPELNARIGEAASKFTDVGLRNLFAEQIRKEVKADIGIYHSGGVRLDSLAAGDISTATILNVEPFGSRIATMKMTTAQLKALIMAKFNNKENLDEAHYIDLNCTIPYTVLTAEKGGDAIDVLFPTLKDDKVYSIAIGDYIYKTYKDFNCTDGKYTDILITDVLEKYIRSMDAIAPDNAEHQKIEVATEVNK